MAANAVILAEAQYETGAHVFAIESGATRVSSVAVVDNSEFKFAGAGDDPRSAFLWRWLIARQYQRQGFGRAAALEMFD